MKTTGYLIVIASFIHLLTNPITLSGRAADNCVIEVETEKKDCTAGKKNGEFIIKPKTGTAPFKYIFYEVKTGRFLQKDFTKQSVQNLKKGTYHCRVIDNSGCNNQVEFTIQ